MPYPSHHKYLICIQTNELNFCNVFWVSWYLVKYYLIHIALLLTANGIFLTKLRMNQETHLSVTPKTLPMQNHDSHRLHWYFPRLQQGILSDVQEEGLHKVEEVMEVVPPVVGKQREEVADHWWTKGEVPEGGAACRACPGERRSASVKWWLRWVAHWLYVRFSVCMPDPYHTER